MKNYLKLMRVHHYIKNVLIFVPLFFSRSLFSQEKFIITCLGFLIFSLICSVIYIFNDIQDIEKDRNHPVKCNRPLATGVITKKEAYIAAMTLCFLGLFLQVSFFYGNNLSLIILLLYLILNLLYSYKLKNIPIVDVLILVMGYILRIYFGALLVQVSVSSWLYLTVLSLSFFLGLGKRRNELIKRGKEYRQVLQYYNKEFLDKSMYMFLGITIVFYSLWCEDISVEYGGFILFTVPIVMLSVLKYSLNIEKDSDGDPVEVILSDPIMVLIVSIYVVIIFYVLYL